MRFRTGVMIIWIILSAFLRLVAGVCNTFYGPAGSLECVAWEEYNNTYQWTTCLTDAYIRRKSGGKHVCDARAITYCHYQCMLERHEREEGPVYYDCACDPKSPLKSPLNDTCYSPDGTDCSWYRGCLEAKNPCKESGRSSYTVGFGEKLCTLYNQHYSKFNTTGQEWIDAARRCIQVALVPLIRQYTSVNCSTIKQTAYESYSRCYTNPFPGAPSICSLSAKDILRVFVTVKSEFENDFFATGDQLLETALECGGVYAEKTIQIVLQGVYNNTDNIDHIYSKLMENLRDFLGFADSFAYTDIFIDSFIPNKTHTRRSTEETNVNVIFLSRVEYDLNYIRNRVVNVTAAVDRVMDAIEKGELHLGLPTFSVSQCVDTGCTNATRTVRKCDANTGPVGSLECVALKEYNYKYQWSTCLSNAYIQEKSGQAHLCNNQRTAFCNYPCMLESHGIGKGPVYYDCDCNPKWPEKSPLPAKCYSPDGTDCSWYKECLEVKYPCKESGSSYAVGFGDKFCTLYSQHNSKFNTIGQQWIDAVRRCLQVALVPLIRQYTSVSCSAIKHTAYESYSGCYTSPYPGAPSICSLGAKNILQVFVTVKSAFVDDFFATGDQFLETALKCGGVYAEHTIQIVIKEVYNSTDYTDKVYNKLMKGLRSYFKNNVTLLADDIFIAPFIPNKARNRRSIGETNVNVIFLPRAEYDLNYKGNPGVNTTASVDRVMEAIKNGEIDFGLQIRSVSQCVDTGCMITTRTVMPTSSALQTMASLTVLLTGVLLSKYAGPEYCC